MKKLILALFPLILILACKSGSESQLTYSNINIAEAQKRIETNPSLIVIDVRTPGETANGIITGAKLIDYRQANFASELDNLNKNASYLIYCKSGGRSAKASKLMIDKGFTKVANMEGGYDAWSKK